MLRFALYIPCKDLTFILYLERKKIHNMAEKWGYVKPSLTPSAYCCQGVCTEICLPGSLKLLTPGCVIPTAQLEFCWLNQCIKAHSVTATNGRLIRELYITNICIYREKLKYIHVYSPFCMTQTFSAVLLDLLIFNSPIWGLVLVHVLNSWDQLCARGKTKLQLCSHESPGFKASLGIFTSTAIKDSCKSKSLWLPGRRFSCREGNWSAPEKGGPSVRQMQGDTQRMAAGLGGTKKCIKRHQKISSLDFFLYAFDIIVGATSGGGGFPQKSPNTGGTLWDVQKSPFRKIKVTEKTRFLHFELC